jgi:thermitase
MKKLSSKTTVISFLLVMTILFMESASLINFSSYGISNGFQWFKQWPFNISNIDGLSEEMCNFAYNRSHVELVIGYEEVENHEFASLVVNEKGRITNQILLNNITQVSVISIPTNKVSKFLREVVLNENIEYIEPNWKFEIDATSNDPGWINQWGPAKIEANIAWDTQKGNYSVLVAVVDTGIYNHSDLAKNYVALGYDWVNDDSDPTDDNGHGTHCAGIIAATLNNSKGIAGLAQVRVMAEKGLAHNGIGYSDDLANAIIHAADQGAKIISCSWGSSQESQLIHAAIKYATNTGALVIAAAGNSGTNTRHYPAAYPEVVAVTATNENDNPALFTTYGDWVDIAAPGTSIYSTYLWNDYVSMSGTSMACPHVAGVAALILSQYPTMSNEQVRFQLLYTADDLGATGFDVFYGYGRVNARKAITESITIIGSKILEAPLDTVYFFYTNPKEGIAVETAYDAIAEGIIYGLTKHPQKQSFTSSSYLTLESGELNASTINNGVAVFFGGPCSQKTVSYYENAGFTPVKFEANETHYMFTTQNNAVVASLSRAAVNSGHEDLFVIEVLMDKGNLVVTMYGFTWKGTWACGIYFKETISENFNGYSDKCYIFHWIDDLEQNGIPESNEIQQEYSMP